MHCGIRETDVFVCGGGPAGLAAAIAARQAGFRVTVADAARPPIDKACGEGIMPDGLAALREIGVELCPDFGVPFGGIRFADALASVEARFPNDSGFGMRRTVLHTAMIRRAAEIGVAMHWGSPVVGLRPGGVIVNNQVVRARFVVGADGQQSRLRVMGQFALKGSVSQRFGFRRHYEVTPWTDSVEVYWSDVGQMYVTPVGPNQVCVLLISRRPDLRFEGALPLFPELAGKLGAAPFNRTVGGVTAMRRLQCVQRDHIALIGDAAGSVDALTGEGLSLAFRQAIALARAMRLDNLADYEKAHRRLVRLPQLMARLMLRMDRHPRFRRRALRALAAEPHLFARLLAIHIGAMSPSQMGVRGTLTLGWGLLTA